MAGADLARVAVACAPVLLDGVISTLQFPLALAADGAGDLVDRAMYA